MIGYTLTEQLSRKIETQRENDDFTNLDNLWKVIKDEKIRSANLKNISHRKGIKPLTIEEMMKKRNKKEKLEFEKDELTPDEKHHIRGIIKKSMSILKQLEAKEEAKQIKLAEKMEKPKDRVETKTHKVTITRARQSAERGM